MSDLLLDSAVDSSIRVTALAAAVALVLALFRIRSSRTRHAAWTAVMMAMLLMPLLVSTVPGVPVSVPDAVAQMTPPVTLVDVNAVPLPADQSPAARTEAAPSTPSVAATSPAPAALAEPAVETSVSWSAVALVVYFLGAVLLVVRLLVGTFHLLRIRRSSRPVVVTSAAGEVLESALVATPVTIGLFAPRIILPLAWQAWTPETLAAVLAHERAHAARRDPLVAVLARVNCAIFWFHPLAWWLERTLATLAEHVCDDAAVRAVTRRSYAETLLDIAAMVRRNNGRVVWQGVGVDGDGRLGQRIDRVLAGLSVSEPSRWRRLTVAASCAAAIVVAVACRQEQGNVPPLRENPEIAAQERASQERTAFYQSARDMTAEQAAALERELERDPENTLTREKLLTYYTWTGRNTQPWNENVAARRRHALWLAEHHPDSELVTRAAVTRTTDHEGYARLRALWLARSAGTAVPARTLNNAAWFFQGQENAIAEEILLRAMAQHPAGLESKRSDGSMYYWSWSRQLGQLYAFAIMKPPRPDPREVNAETAAWGRERLTASTDARVLYTAGWYLTRWSYSSRATEQSEQRELGKRLLERASQSDSPVAEQARQEIRMLDPRERLRFTQESLPLGSRQGALDKASGAEKLQLLAAWAERDYQSASYFDWVSRLKPGHPAYSGKPEQDRERAAAGFARSKAYVEDVFTLAPSQTNASDYPNAVYRAHMTAGMHALREGNRREAVRHLLEAGELPAPKEQPLDPWWSTFDITLMNYLLKNGERASIIEFLERTAPKREEATRDVMLKEAAAIRAGLMPYRYQLMLANGRL